MATEEHINKQIHSVGKRFRPKIHQNNQFLLLLTFHEDEGL